MFREKTPESQQSIWISSIDIVSSPASNFYQKLDGALRSFGFGDKVRALCEPFYCSDETVGGRPGIDPEVYFKMTLIGFFENISSERGLAARCADSLSIRQFLKYDLTELTPHHSSLSRIRQRLNDELYQQIFGLGVAALKQHKLIKGGNISIDASTIEANASLKSLKNRFTGEEYRQYIKRLAEEAGVDTSDPAAVSRFDRKRPGRKTSNADWQNPHDPEAKVGPTKRGTTRMVYKSENVVDLDTGAVLDVDVRPGDESDHHELAQKLFDAEMRVNVALDNPADAKLIASVTGDKGYYNLAAMGRLRESGIRVNIKDPIRNRRIDKLDDKDRSTVRSAQRTTASASGKDLMKRRGMHLERSFEHILDEGGGRRTTLRGRSNILKRYRIQALGYNLSLLMRTLIGIGTPKQAIAKAFYGLETTILALLSLLFMQPVEFDRRNQFAPQFESLRF
jgi:transposase